jgi:hypothetical protein
VSYENISLAAFLAWKQQPDRYEWIDGMIVRCGAARVGYGCRLVGAEYCRGPVPMHALDLTITFDQIYAGTSVPAILHPIQPAAEEET